MKKRPDSNPAESFFLRSARSKIAVLALSALSAGGCKVCMSWSSKNPEAFEIYKRQEATREAAVDEDGFRTIHMKNADAIIELQRVDADKCRTKIIGLMDVYKGSPLHNVSDHEREFNLPKNSGPWSKLVIEAPKKDEDKKDDKKEEADAEKKPDTGEFKGAKIVDACGETVGEQGRITLRTKNDAIAMVFDCDELKPEGLSYCVGREISPSELSPEGASDDKEEKKGDDLGCGAEKEEKKKEEKKPEQKPEEKKEEKKDEKKPDAPDQIFKDGKIVIDTTPALEAVFDKLRPALNQTSIGELKVIATNLAEGTKWKKEVDEIMADLKDDDAKSFIKKPNLVNAILFLLNQKPDKIPALAQLLGVQLPDKKEEKKDKKVAAVPVFFIPPPPPSSPATKTRVATRMPHQTRPTGIQAKRASVNFGKFLSEEDIRQLDEAGRRLKESLKKLEKANNELKKSLQRRSR